jgi:hypothetical protein
MRAAGRQDARNRTNELGIAGDQGGRNPPPPHQLGRTIGVRQHGLQEARALDEPGPELFPVVGFDDQWHMAGRPRPLDSRRVFVDAVEHAGIAQVPVGDREAAVDLLRAKTGKAVEKRTPVRPHRAIRFHHLVVNAGKRTIV